jgi:hypothetical protein
MKQAFENRRFSAKSEKTIMTVNSILNEYQEKGYTLTLRQLYYQMVARDYIENSDKSYTRLGALVSDARLAGLVDWEMIEDRGRETRTLSHWSDPAEIVKTAAQQFRTDKWEDQPCHVEVMVEKQALEGILLPVCRNLDIPFTANKGYSSQSAFYEAGKRLAQQANSGKQVWVLYLGDHDPSGIDMTRDVEERLRQFSGVPIRVKRLALNMDQVIALHPPENPAKVTDTRFKDYALQYGESSWELDAVEPGALANLVITAVEERRDPDLWSAALQVEEAMRGELQRFADSYRPAA